MGTAKALIIGVDSTIGCALARLLRARGDQVIGSTRRNSSAPEKSCIFVDLAKSESATWNLPEADFAVICAAISCQADCREKFDVARQVNVTTPVMLAERLVARGTRVIFLSSSAVFDGELPFAPADRATAPKSAYGMLKSEAEAAMLGLGRKVSILRMTKVIAPDMPLLAKWIKSLARGGGIQAFSDLNFCPVAVSDVTNAITAIVSDASGGGIYQISGNEDISYFRAAQHFAERLNVPLNRVEAALAIRHGIPSVEVPRFTSLDASRFIALTGWTPPSPSSVLDEAFGPVLSKSVA